MEQRCFVLDGTRCSGCKTCQLACQDYKDLEAGIAFRKVYEFEGGRWDDNGKGCYTPDVFAYYLSVSCNHCDSPACQKACSTTAISKDGNGLVRIDFDKCTNCGACLNACPYNAPVRDEVRNTVVKCDGCAARVEAGELPICVKACPQRALHFGTRADMQAAWPKAVPANVPPLPDKNLTSPNLLLIPSRKMLRKDVGDGQLVNLAEVS